MKKAGKGSNGKNPEKKESTNLRDQVAKIVESIRPAVQGDGGDIEFVDVDAQGTVSVRLHGACIGCPSAAMTLKMGVERVIKEKLPQISKVVCV